MAEYTFPPALRSEPSGTRYSLLGNASGGFLCASRADGCSVVDRPGDEGMWTVGAAEGGGTSFTNAATGLTVVSAREPAAFAVDGNGHVEGDCGALSLPDAGGALDADGGTGGAAASWELLRGPDKLPSEYLATMREDGVSRLVLSLVEERQGQRRRLLLRPAVSL